MASTSGGGASSVASTTETGAAGAAGVIVDGVDVVDGVARSLPQPSHILPDGRFVYLPPPTDRDRRNFFERSIARHGLLEEDLKKRQKEKTTDVEAVAEEKDGEGKKKKVQKQQQNKVHPLALASARIEGDGISELNRAINLSGLVASGEYFGMTNVVDPSLEINANPATAEKQNQQKSGEQGTTTAASTDATANQATATATTGTTTGAGGTGPPAADNNNKANLSAEGAAELQQEQRVKASFVLKRKRAQFARAAVGLGRHRRRLKAAFVTQRRPDQRLCQLRRRGWRLVAPEHGTRALPHAARPSGVVACDVDVYLKSGAILGRLASRVPRYATLELKPDYKVSADLDRWNRRVDALLKKEKADEDAMDVDDEDEDEDEEDRETKDKDKESNDKQEETKEEEDEEEDDDNAVWTVAEPFALADPTLGKLDADFDPSKVPMLSLQFDIEKDSTGFCQSAVLEAVSASSSSTPPAESSAAESNGDKSNNNNGKKKSHHQQHGGGDDDDEQVLFSLQHSLFCAKLFESIRRELARDTEDVLGTVGLAAAASKAAAAGKKGQQQHHHRHHHGGSPQSVAWLASDETGWNFLPPPSYMGGDTNNSQGLAPLCVVHCHEGEVKVQLDCEYTLRVKLVEAGTTPTEAANNSADTTNGDRKASISGSQSPEQLTALCQTLLLNAEERYHIHSVRAAERFRKHEEEEEGRQQASNHQMKHLRKKVATASPRILQSCVSLGSKLLFERRIRATLIRVDEWLRKQQQQQSPAAERERLRVEWMSLSVFDFHAQFAVAFRSWVADAHLVNEELTVTSTNAAAADDDEGQPPDDGASSSFRKVRFCSDAQFELYLKMQLERLLRE